MLLLLCTGLSDELKQSIIDYWYSVSVDSPCKTDTVRKRDDRGILLRMDDENGDYDFEISDDSDDDIKYQTVRNRYYTQSDKQCYDEWQYNNIDILTRERLSRGRPLITPKTFTKYRPHHINHKDYLSQFACEDCTLFTFKHTALHKQLDRSHHCGTSECNNWAAPMGPQCSCADCSSCVILKLKELPLSALLHELCCDNDSESVPWLECAKGHCDRILSDECAIDRYQNLLVFGHGCKTFNVDDNTEVRYKVIGNFKHSKATKSKKCEAYTYDTWLNFKFIYLQSLQSFLHHYYGKIWQFKQRDKISNIIDGNVALPENILFSSIDSIANIKAARKVTTHGSFCNTVDLSLLVIYDIINVGGNLQKSAFCYISNYTKHGWYSAIPAYRDYIQRRKAEFQKRGVSLTTNVVWSDRGPTDFWTAPFIAFAKDAAIDNNINLCLNTTAAGHGKWMHDQIGGVVGRKIKYGFKEDLIPVNIGDSIAGKTCIYLNTEFNQSANGNIKRYFIELHPEQIRYGPSPVKTIKVTSTTGIKKYNCVYMNRSGDIVFREYSCSCTNCIGTKYEDCIKDMYCGHWINTNIKPYQSYDAYKVHADCNNE